MRRRSSVFVASCLLAGMFPAALAGEARYPTYRTRIAEEPYPLQVSVSFTAALFHWLDSLARLQQAGFSGGKTIKAHRNNYYRVLGPPTDRDQQLLERFAEIRRANVRAAGRSRDPVSGPWALLVAFLDATDLDDAIARSRSILDPVSHAALQAILEHFAPKYERIWKDGAIPHRFVRHLRKSRDLPELLALLDDMSDFFGVDPKGGPPPHVILMPVDDGYGTHAQANGRHLLIELRPGDRLSTTASVIVHENAHMLMNSIEAERLQRLNEHIRELGPGVERVAGFLREAVPTALGQGIADSRFQSRRWSIRAPWYHRPEIDGYAKRIYPEVVRALEEDGSFDEAFLTRVLEIYFANGSTPRSP